MSDLQRSFVKAKLARLPPEAPMSPEPLREGHEDGESLDTLGILHHDPHDDDASSASSASSTGTIKPLASRNLFARPGGASSKKSQDQLPWSDFFEQELYLEGSFDKENITYHVYLTPPAASGPLFVTHHGAGSSGLSFAVFASIVRKMLPSAGILSVDARGHGETVVHTKVPRDPSQPPIDYSLSTLSKDLLQVLELCKEKMDWKEQPSMILVGHSLGGAVVTDVAKTGELGDKLLGYAVLDVVEGSAMDALQSMQTYLSSRPPAFPSIASGIEWHTRSRTIRNPTSARVSVPSLLRRDADPNAPRPWIWHTDLSATQPFWENWFIGLSKKFLEAKGGKLLLLAGTDRLDKELTIGQMQGKYQLQVFPEAGHFIQEDLPERTAALVVEFYKRNDRSTLVLPPKVADILKAKQQQQQKQ
ncbi:protein phosphatase methylesterase [Xylona heveae TC161]|uniref:Protein phosphatase methylesterase 1 n=1 Tax=Xylona heveae (strain CBS 132557 / TC161) TaxID=1328760 RepID=A0A165JAW1_XYLHT|nr:protein phosphatase methylesterase [Xylona heveae TC161]KZF25988.1 protein phosphatase methylesterase [Xylona heveae TC161]